jgi:aryl sulfotransferase
LESYVEPFVEGGLDPLGTWQEHVGSWLGARSGRSDFLLVRYEDLKGATEAELRRIVDFIGLEANNVQLAMAAEQCSFAAMRKLELMQAKAGIIDRSRVDRPAIRSGRAGGWREELAAALAARIADAFQPVMEDLGYLGEPEPRIRRAGS